jgi:deoxyribodipyrimidine photo-lyase
VASDKQEVGARTIRKKITDKLSTWLVDIPALPKRSGSDPSLPSGMRDEFTKDKVKDWEALLREVLADDRVDSTVEEVKDFPPGPAAGLQV